MGKQQPSPPDPRSTSAAQTGTNVTTANANTLAANGNITTPYGSRTTNFTTQDIVDPYTGKTNTVEIPNVTTTLSPAQQAIQQQTQGAQLNLGTLANTQSKFLQDYEAKPFQFNDTSQSRFRLPQPSSFGRHQWFPECLRPHREDRIRGSRVSTVAQSDQQIAAGKVQADAQVAQAQTQAKLMVEAAHAQASSQAEAARAQADAQVEAVKAEI